ncbi:hypothetical protein NIES4073_64140 [Kalymmatonema gypsitolerans NIES-4073]|nr:hypothetical protein NIES4073_64140 [Scytonema sp. NIES-4073]
MSECDFYDYLAVVILLSFNSSSPALYAKHERREECERVDDAPLTNAGGEGRGDEGNEQIYRAVTRVRSDFQCTDAVPRQ